MEQKRELAMYAVRGIQDYIFRTAKVKDAIGASETVDTIELSKSCKGGNLIFFFAVHFKY